MDIRLFSAVAAGATATLATAAFIFPASKTSREDFGTRKAPVEKFHGTQTINIPTRTGEGLTADFTVEGTSALEPVFTENFDNGAGNWRFDPTEEVKWTVKRIGEPGSAKSFSEIDPSDVSSLYVDGPYQIFKRETSHAFSPEMEVPANGTLSFYAGFSQNYDDECRLELEICTPADTIHLWNSSEETGDKPWRWHPVKVSLGGFAGQKVTFRLTYGPGGKDSFNTGGYMGDFAIDGFTISGAKAVDSIEVTTGETVTFSDISSGSPVKREWTMPGAVPETSDLPSPQVYYTRDGSYDVTLTVTDAAGNRSVKTRTAFVKVTGTEPVARILPPATFRLSSTRKHLVAPLVPVTFADASAGFPDSWQWSFTGADPDSKKSMVSEEERPEVAYSYLHDQTATLHVSNSHGSSDASCELSVEYSGLVNNLLPTDRSTNLDMGDWGVFPGSNTRKITAFAERFSRPSRPVMIDGAYVFFTKAQATELADQIANVGVHLYSSKDGKPDKRLDSMWWSVFELDTPSSAGSDLVGTAFPFTECPVVDDEFFIVVDGIPEFSEGCCVSFAMADFRPEGNTALMLKEGEWVEANEYFGAGKCTSFMIYPSVHHSVMSLLPAGTPAEIEVESTGGVTEIPLFSYMGYKTPAETDADWLRLTGSPNGLTVDTLRLQTDPLPAGAEPRTAHIVLTDGASSLTLTVTQKSGNGGADTLLEETGLFSASPSPFTGTFTLRGLMAGEDVYITSVSGLPMARFRAKETDVTVDGSSWSPGVYLVHSRGRVLRIIRR